MSDTPVAELFAELGFDVDQKALQTAENGLKQIELGAERAVAAVDQMGAAIARAGQKQGFWASVRQSFSEGLQEGVQPRAAPVQKKQGFWSGLRDSFNEGWQEGLKQPAPAEPKTPPKVPAEEAHKAGGEVKGLTGIVEKAQHAMNGFMALFAAHEIQHFAHELMDASSALELTSKRLGITTEELQQLQYAANASDISAGSLANGLKFLQVNSTKAAEGSKAQAKAFRELGVAVKDADGNARPISDLLEDVADHVAKIQDPAKQSAIAMQVFGRAGVELVPMLQEGGEGIRKLREEAEALGGGLTETLIENAGEYEAALKRFNFAFLGVKSAIGNFLLPILTKLSQAFTTLVGWFNTLQNKTKYLQTLLGVGLALALAKVVMWLNAVGTAGVIAWLKNIGPIILMAAAIAGVSLVLEDLYQALTGGKSAIGKWLDEWQGIGTMSELVKSIAAGIDSIKTAFNNFLNSPGAAMLDTLKELAMLVVPKNSILGAWLSKNGVELTHSGSLSAAADERANRPIATGRGIGAGAISNVDIPRAMGRGLLADADVTFGQAKGSPYNAQTGNSDSPAINVTVNAHTGATAKDIAHHVKRGIEEHQQKQNKNLRNALVPHAAGTR